MKKRYIILIILLVIILSVGTFFGYRYFKQRKNKAQAEKISNNVATIQEDKIDYVFVEINPSFVIALKNDIVVNVACLNNDCLTIYDDINIKGKDVDTSLEELYNLASDKGFDTTGGVHVKSIRCIDVSHDYIIVSTLTAKEQEELLSQVKNNEDIKNANENYYQNLYNELKKDSAYGKDYSCTMSNDELECYLTDSSINAPSHNIINEKQDWYNKLLNTLTRFNIKYEDTDELYLLINNYKYQYYEELKKTGTQYTICDGSTNVEYAEGMDSDEWLNQLKEADSNGTLDSGCRQVGGDGEVIYDLKNVFARYADSGIDYINMKDLNLVEPAASVVNNVK